MPFCIKPYACAACAPHAHVDGRESISPGPSRLRWRQIGPLACSGGRARAQRVPALWLAQVVPFVLLMMVGTRAAGRHDLCRQCPIRPWGVCLGPLSVPGGLCRAHQRTGMAGSRGRATSAATKYLALALALRSRRRCARRSAAARAPPQADWPGLGSAMPQNGGASDAA